MGEQPRADRPRVRRAGAGDVPTMRAVLARALEHDPFVRWIVHRPSERRFGRYVDLVLRRLTLPHGEVYTTDEVRGAALWAPPGGWEPGLGEQLGHLPHVLRIVGWRRLGAVMRASERIESWRPRGPYYYLALLGTAPSARGRGIGTALLRPVLARCDAEGVMAAVDTASASNIEWYGRLGFELAGHTPLPDGPTVATLVRRPARDAAPPAP